MNTLRGLITLVLLASFLGLVLWSMRGGNKARFDAAARIPLDDLPPSDLDDSEPLTRKTQK
jgi:cbb3-type cytochrome oxidase subunit 3